MDEQDKEFNIIACRSCRMKPCRYFLWDREANPILVLSEDIGKPDCIFVTNKLLSKFELSSIPKHTIEQSIANFHSKTRLDPFQTYSWKSPDMDPENGNGQNFLRLVEDGEIKIIRPPISQVQFERFKEWFEESEKLKQYTWLPLEQEMGIWDFVEEPVGAVEEAADVPRAKDNMATNVQAQSKPESKESRKIFIGIDRFERSPGQGWRSDKGWQKADNGKWEQYDNRGWRKDKGRRVQTKVSIKVDWMKKEFIVDPNLQYKDEHTEIKMLSGDYYVSSGIDYDVKSGDFSADLIKGDIHGAVLDKELKGNLFGSENSKLAAEVLSAGANAGIGISANKKEGEAVVYAEVGAEANIAKVEGEITWGIPIPYTARKFIIGLGGEASIGAKAKAGLRAGSDKKHGTHVSLGAKAALGVGLGANVILGIK